MNNEYFIYSQHSISQYLHKNVDGNGMTNDINVITGQELMKNQHYVNAALLWDVWSLPGDMTELYSDAFGHAPLLREHSPILFFIVHKLTLDPRIASIYLVKPRHL